MPTRTLLLVVCLAIAFCIGTVYCSSPAHVRFTISASDECIQYPNNTDCATYIYPDEYSKSDIDNLCGAMFFMPGCSVQTACENPESPDATKSSEYCKSFSVLKDICLDMGGMKGCKNYNSLCKTTGSVVQQCSATKTFPLLPTTDEVNEYVQSICTEMTMDGCEKCTLASKNGVGAYLQCDLLAVYSQLCLSMPDMSQCSAWRKMCKDDEIKQWPFCTNVDPDSLPPMRMYFHQSLQDIVLFRELVPRNGIQYTLVIFGILALGIVLEGLRAFRGWVEEKTTAFTKANYAVDKINEYVELEPSGTSFSRRIRIFFIVDATRGVIVFVETILGMALMLIAMTFNVGMFIAVCAGTGFGSMFFGRMNKNVAKTGCH